MRSQALSPVRAVSTARNQDRVDKYIQVIKKCHRAMISDPLIILRQLLTLCQRTLSSRPFIVFDYHGNTLQDMFGIYWQAVEGTTPDVYEIFARLEEQLSTHHLPMFAELQAVWVAFYKYYYPMLPTPAAGSLLEKMLIKAKNHTVAERRKLLTADISGMSVPGNEHEHLLNIKQYAVNENASLLTPTLFYKLLDLLCDSRRQYAEAASLLNKLLDALYRFDHTSQVCVDAITYITGKLEKIQNFDTHNQVYIFEYLVFVVELLNQYQRKIDINAQQQFIRIIFKRFKFNKEFLNFVERLVDLNFFDNIIRDEVHQVLVTRIFENRFDVPLYGRTYKVLKTLNPSLDCRFDAFLVALKQPFTGEELEIDKTDEDAEARIKRFNWSYLLSSCEYSIKYLPDEYLYQILLIYINALEQRNDREMHYQEICVIEGGADILPGHLIDRFGAKLFSHIEVARSHSLIHGIDAIFKLYQHAIPVEKQDLIWQKIILILNHHYLSLIWRYNPSNFSEYLRFLSKKNIPADYLQPVIAALKSALFEMGGYCDGNLRSLATRQLVSLLSDDEQEVYLSECFEMLLSSNWPLQVGALFVIAAFPDIPSSKRMQAVARMMLVLDDNLIDAGINAGVDVPMFALMQTTDEKNYFFEYLYGLLQRNRVNFTRFAQTCLLKMQLSSEQSNRLAVFIFDDLTARLRSNTLDVDLLRLRLQLLYSLNHHTDLCSKFICLLLKILDNHSSLLGNRNIFVKILIKLAGAGSLTINVTLKQAKTLIFDHHDDSSEILNTHLKLISYFPVEVQIAYMTHVESVWHCRLKDAVQTRLDMELQCRDMHREAWNHVYRLVDPADKPRDDGAEPRGAEPRAGRRR